MTLRNTTGSICIECARKYGTLPKHPIGVWRGPCDICGREGDLAAAAHDYGMSDKEVRDARVCKASNDAAHTLVE